MISSLWTFCIPSPKAIASIEPSAERTSSSRSAMSRARTISSMTFAGVRNFERASSDPSLAYVWKVVPWLAPRTEAFSSKYVSTACMTTSSGRSLSLTTRPRSYSLTQT